MQENSGYAEDGLVEYLEGCSRVSCSSQAWSARWRWQSVKDLSLGLGRLKITHLRKIDFIGTLP